MLLEAALVMEDCGSWPATDGGDAMPAKLFPSAGVAGLTGPDDCGEGGCEAGMVNRVGFVVLESGDCFRANVLLLGVDTPVLFPGQNDCNPDGAK